MKCERCDFYKQDLDLVIKQREAVIKREVDLTEKFNILLNERLEIVKAMREMFLAKKIYEEQLMELESKILKTEMYK